MSINSSIAVMYAVTPCHAGSGSALGVVDLPIQRERHTNWPMIQASGVKGAFRANFDRFKNDCADTKQIEQLTEKIFGTDKGGNDNGGFAGSSSFGDARILAYPMRSNIAPFVWITCPAVLKRFAKDLAIAEKETFDASKFVLSDSNSAVWLNGNISESDILLEDFEVKTEIKKIDEFSRIAEYFKEAERLLLVSDEVFNYGVTDCTQIMAQIKINPATGTTSAGSLRYQEELPGDTIMYTVVIWGDSKFSEELKAENIKSFITKQVISTHIQIAGDETCGRGIFQLSWK